MVDNLFYYRDGKGLALDAIIEFGGRWVGVEVKLSDAKADEGAAAPFALQ